MCLHLCNWIDQQHPVQIDPYRSLIFCFSLFLIICQISSSAACFLFYWRGWGPLENTKKFSFYLLLSPFSEFWLFLGILAFFPWIWLCVEFQTFGNSDFFLGILIFWGGILTFTWDFWLFRNSDIFLRIRTFFLLFWLFLNSEFF